MIVLQMVPPIRKHKGVTRIHAQLMVDLVTGMNGDHALLSVEVEIKQEPDDATILFLSLVGWSVMGTSPIANVVTWIHALQHAQLRWLHTENDFYFCQNRNSSIDSLYFLAP